MSIKSVKTEIFGMMIFSALAPERVEKHTGSGNLVSKKTVNFPQSSFISKAYERSSEFLITA